MKTPSILKIFRTRKLDIRKIISWSLAFAIVFPPYFVISSPEVYAKLREAAREVGSILSIESGKYAFIGIDADTKVSAVFFFDGSNNIRVPHDGVTVGNAQYDEFSNKIVYQSLVDNVWHIFLYDVTTDTTARLSHGGKNNVSPSISKGQVVWQSWVDETWDIFFYDGTASERLTSDKDPNIDPQISDGYVVWRSYDSDKPGSSKKEIQSENYEIEMFDSFKKEKKKLTSGKKKNDHLSIEYPRIVWQMNDGNDEEVTMHDISSGVTALITDNDFDDLTPKIKKGKIAWLENIKGDEGKIKNMIKEDKLIKEEKIKLIPKLVWLGDPGECPIKEKVCAYNYEEKAFLNYVNECYAIKFGSPIAHEGVCNGNEIPPGEPSPTNASSTSFEELIPTPIPEIEAGMGTNYNEGSFDEDGNVVIEEQTPVEPGFNENTASNSLPLVDDAEEPTALEESVIMQVGEVINTAITVTASTTAELLNIITPSPSPELTPEPTPELTPESTPESASQESSITEPLVEESQ